MRNLLKVATALLALCAFSTSSIAAECTPIPPKDVEGHIEFVPVARQSIAGGYFEQNGCDWGGNDQLNGLDAVVLDITGITGPATATAAIEEGFLTTFESVFLDEGCTRVGEVVRFSGTNPEVPEAYVITIPVGAKWMLVQGSTELPAGDPAASVTVKVHSDGLDCDVPEKPKKKKKRRRR